MISDEPGSTNHYLAAHVERLLLSLRHWTGRCLVDASLTMEEQSRRVFDAPFVVLSHNTDTDPILNYANRTGLELFELSWQQLLVTPSRQTAQPIHRAERERLLTEVARRGYIDDYRGIRISKNGRRFQIDQAIVWNLFDERGAPYGQAATFSAWRFLDS
jgi:MEKHLA domain